MATVNDGILNVVVVNRTSQEDPVSVIIETDGFEPEKEATLTTLGSDELYDKNTREDSEKVTSDIETMTVSDGAVFNLPSYSIARIDFERA